ncbi:hypothetical protein E2C01_021053 [Portunus trituberculatus]|uniref:Uncharacterized protein n=1 Tax=Portunus trituberculatus TaxID=210409 RepID=A0A5B7E3E7_PORTR|nr:hypothetical protein [Portunus trituberculatus]
MKSNDKYWTMTLSFTFTLKPMVSRDQFWDTRGSGGNISEAVISLVEMMMAGVTYAGDGVGEGRASLVTRGRGLWGRGHGGGNLGHQALAVHGPLRDTSFLHMEPIYILKE